MLKIIKKLFVPSFTDQEVATIHAQNKKALVKATKAAKSTRDLLSDDSITLKIHIATGGRNDS